MAHSSKEQHSMAYIRETLDKTDPSCLPDLSSLEVKDSAECGQVIVKLTGKMLRCLLTTCFLWVFRASFSEVVTFQASTVCPLMTYLSSSISLECFTHLCELITTSHEILTLQLLTLLTVSPGYNQSVSRK